MRVVQNDQMIFGEIDVSKIVFDLKSRDDSQAAKEEEQAQEFVKARRAQSAVESAINGLEVHGLDVCPDHGIDGFKRYVALAVVARNIHRIGAILWQQDVERARRKNRFAEQEKPDKLAA